MLQLQSDFGHPASLRDSSIFVDVCVPKEVSFFSLSPPVFHFRCAAKLAHKSFILLSEDLTMKHVFYAFLILVLTTAALSLSSNSALAQAVIAVAQLSGTVRDASGAFIANAPVTLRNLDNNRTYMTMSDASGYYIVPNLPPGPYELSVTYTGFEKFVQSGVRLTVGQTATVDVTLAVQGRQEVVNVTVQTPAIEPTRTELSSVIETQQIASLPISGRLFTDFALLTPGVTTGRTSVGSTITEFEVTRVSFAGMRDLSNQVTVDGADHINTATGSQRATPPQESVQEFRVVNNSFGAEYGRALGGIVNIVTKSGTNSFHGSVYDYFQNNVLNARSLLQPEPQPDTLRQNQFGVTFGGPIKKDKTFFFANYEGQRRGESPTYPTVLINNIALINASKAALGIPPENLNILKTKDNDYVFARVDHQLSSRHQLSVRYNLEDARDLNQLVGATLDGGGIGAPSSGHNVSLSDQSLHGTVTSQFGTNVVNTVLGQYARRHYNFPGVTGEPNLDIPNELLFGHNFGVLDKIWETRIQGSDSLSWVRGKHLVRFGGDVNHTRNFVLWPGFTPIRIIIPGINCLVDFANFVKPSAAIASNFAAGPCPMALPPLGAPGFAPFPAVPGPNPADLANGVPIAFQSAPLGTAVNFTPGVSETLPTNGWPYAYLPDQEPNFSVNLNHNYYGFFVQDQWKVTPKLTLNYGLRYDFESGLSDQMDVSHKGFQPRIGLAYSPDRKTVIRAGFGLFNDRYAMSFLFITYPQRPAVLANADLPPNRRGAESAVYELNQYPYIPIPGVPTPAQLAKDFFTTGQVFSHSVTPTPTAPTPVGYSYTDRHSPIPYSLQTSLEINREIGNGLTVGVGYLFVAAHHLLRSTLGNLCPVEGITGGSYPCDPAGSAPPGYPAGKNYYSGVPRYPAGLICCNDLTGNSAYHGGVLQVNKTGGKYFNLNASYTLSHTMDDATFATFISVPEDVFRRNLERATSNQDARHRFVSNFSLAAPSNSFLRNFLLSNIITLQSPRPFTLFVGFDSNNDLIPAADRVGNLSRNTYKGDSFRSWDVRLQRTINLREGMRLDVAADAFNLLNRPNVDEVVGVYGTYNFCGGVLPQQYKDAASLAIQAGQVGGCPVAGPPVPNPLFGTPRTMFNPRQLQLSMKLLF
jgi:outer membrane receptor protein involved in Fe transport